MSYRLTHFDTIPLPDRMPDDDLSVAAVESALLASVGGVVDYYGTLPRLPRQQTLTMTGSYLGEAEYLLDHAGNAIVDHAGNRILVGTASNRLRAQVDNLRSCIGRQAALWRQRDDDSVRQWRLARLRNVTMRGSVERWAANMAEVTVALEMANGAWCAAIATSSSATLVTNGESALLVTVAGGVTVEDGVLQVAATGTITRLTVVAPAAGISLIYTGTLANGQTLTIDAGAQTVRVGSTDCYQYFALGTAHTADGWLPFPPGDTALVVAADGPGDLSVSHYNQFL